MAADRNAADNGLPTPPLLYHGYDDFMDTRLKTTIIALEKELLQPEVRASSSGRLNELLAKDYFEFGRSGKKYTKDDVLNALPSEEEEKFVTSLFELMPLSPDTVLLTYFLERENLATKNKSSSWRSSIWQMHDGKWQMIFHQGTPVKDKGGEKGGRP